MSMEGSGIDATASDTRASGGIIIPLYKGKGSKSDCCNYRGITLLSAPAKVFAHVILVRIRPTLLQHRRPQQSGFTPGRSTCDHVATLCNIVQRRQDFGHPTFAAYVDLRAAFNSLAIADKAWYPGQDRLFRASMIIPSAVLGQNVSKAHGLTLSQGFNRVVCLLRTHLQQAWIGCWKGRSDQVQLRFCLVRPHLLTWILPTMSLSLLNSLNFSFQHWS